jgi:hypothetical protein
MSKGYRLKISVFYIAKIWETRNMPESLTREYTGMSSPYDLAKKIDERIKKEQRV